MKFLRRLLKRTKKELDYTERMLLAKEKSQNALNIFKESRDRLLETNSHIVALTKEIQEEKAKETAYVEETISDLKRRLEEKVADLEKVNLELESDKEINEKIIANISKILE